MKSMLRFVSEKVPNRLVYLNIWSPAAHIVLGEHGFSNEVAAEERDCWWLRTEGS